MPAGSASSSRFMDILAELQSAHVREVKALQVEVADLHLEMARLSSERANAVDRPSVGTEETRVSGVAERLKVSRSFVSDNQDDGADPPRCNTAGLHGRSNSIESMASSPGQDSVVRVFPRTWSNRITESSRRSTKSSFRSRSALGLGHIVQRGGRGETISFESLTVFCYTLVKNKWFEAVFCCFILVNAVVMALEAQFAGMEIGRILEKPASTAMDEGTWLGFKRAAILHGVSLFFGCLFTVEVVVKIVGLRIRFVLDVWNWLDAVVCILWFVSEMLFLPINSQLFRLARLARLLRMLRLVRNIQGFDSLFIMTTAIRGSISALLWTLILLSIVQMMIAVFLNQYLHEYYFKSRLQSVSSEVDLQQQRDVYIHFGTFTRALFTMFEITLANWPPAIRLLADSAGEWFLLFGVLHKLSVGFAVLGVINGVFMQETFRVASLDDAIMVRQKARACRHHLTKMQNFLDEADLAFGQSDGMDKKAFVTLVSDPQVKLWLESMELDVYDPELLFDLIDKDHDGTINLEEMVAGVSKLKGPARSMDLTALVRDQRHLVKAVLALERACYSSPGVQLETCAGQPADSKISI